MTTTVHFEMYLLLSCEHFIIALRDKLILLIVHYECSGH